MGIIPPRLLFSSVWFGAESSARIVIESPIFVVPVTA
jgi:hypothetical protein